MKNFLFLLLALGSLTFQRVAAGPVQDSLNVREPNPFGHTVMLSVGPSFITSSVYNYFDGTVYKWKSGLQVDARYSYIFRSGFGVGCLYSSSSTHYYPDTFKLHFFGPEATYSARVGRRLQFYVMAALGGEHFQSQETDKWRVGIHEALVGEYRLTRHFAVGLNLSFMSVVLDDKQSKTFEREGITRMGIQGTVNYHF